MKLKTEKYLFKYYEETYEILGENDFTDSTDKRLLRCMLIRDDFEYCLAHGDHITIANRISQGLMWGWLKLCGDVSPSSTVIKPLYPTIEWEDI